MGGAWWVTGFSKIRTFSQLTFHPKLGRDALLEGDLVP
jgi:hypothetical protein